MKKETSRAKEVRRKAREYLLGMMTYYEEPLVIERGQGATVVDIEGREYLDFFAGIVTVGLGHCHRAVTERTVEQARTLQHASTLYLTEPLVDMGERLAEITPGRLKKSFFTSSGTEANETAVLLARSHTGRNEILALRQGYTGRSSLAMGLAGQSGWRLPGSDVGGSSTRPALTATVAPMRRPIRAATWSAPGTSRMSSRPPPPGRSRPSSPSPSRGWGDSSPRPRSISRSPSRSSESTGGSLSAMRSKRALGERAPRCSASNTTGSSPRL